MKKKLAVLVLGTFLLAGLTGCGNSVPDGTVATVNGEPISRKHWMSIIHSSCRCIRCMALMFLTKPLK